MYFFSTSAHVDCSLFHPFLLETCTLVPRGPSRLVIYCRSVLVAPPSLARSIWCSPLSRLHQFSFNWIFFQAFNFRIFGSINYPVVTRYITLRILSYGFPHAMMIRDRVRGRKIRKFSIFGKKFWDLKVPCEKVELPETEYEC